MQRPRNRRCRVCKAPCVGRTCKACHKHKSNKGKYIEDVMAIYQS